MVLNHAKLSWLIKRCTWVAVIASADKSDLMHPGMCDNWQNWQYLTYISITCTDTKLHHTIWYMFDFVLYSTLFHGIIRYKLYHVKESKCLSW